MTTFHGAYKTQYNQHTFILFGATITWWSQCKLIMLDDDMIKLLTRCLTPRVLHLTHIWSPYEWGTPLISLIQWNATLLCFQKKRSVPTSFLQFIWDKLMSYPNCNLVQKNLHDNKTLKNGKGLKIS